MKETKPLGMIDRNVTSTIVVEINTDHPQKIAPRAFKLSGNLTSQ